MQRSSQIVLKMAAMEREPEEKGFMNVFKRNGAD